MHKIKIFFKKHKNNILEIVLFFFLFFLYLSNLSPSVYGGDVGDLITASYVHGVAHPPGYPLFTLLGYLLSHIPLNSTVAYRVGLISVVSSSLGIFFFYKLTRIFTKSILISLTSSLILAFSYLYWLYAEIAEVFSLNVLFVILLLFLSVLFINNPSKKKLFLISFFTGLALTNHHTIIFLFPTILILIIPKAFKYLKSPRTVLGLFGFLILGLSVYVYIPIASFSHPPINWDNVKDLNSFIHLFLRKSYGTFKAGSFEEANYLQRIVSLRLYFFQLIGNVTFPVALVSIVGAIYLLVKKTKLSLALLGGFILSGPVFIVYAGFPLYNSFNLGTNERFMLMSFVFIPIFFAFGLLFLRDKFSAFFNGRYSFLFVLVFLLIPISLFKFNYPRTNLSNVWVGDNLAIDIFRNVPQNGVLIVSGDTVVFNSWYVHFVNKVRPDVDLVNLGAEQPFFSSEKEKYLRKYPKDKTDSNLNFKVLKNISLSRPLASLSVLQFEKKEKLIWLPNGLTSILLKNKKEIPSKDKLIEDNNKIWQELNIPDKKKNIALSSFTISDIPNVYSMAMLNMGNFIFNNYDDGKLATKYYNKAIEIDPDNNKAYLLTGYYLGTKGKCVEAEKKYNKSLAINPFYKMTYISLFNLYHTCFKDDKRSKNILMKYKVLFGSDFSADIKDYLDK
ncbi:DUF2723 domain-containing protein [Patescibacteria group bacterium]|nr:DUF2723 domain-containing protein [Patescibacteria group bacterium]